jgi:hypothetical protein
MALRTGEMMAQLYDVTLRCSGVDVTYTPAGGDAVSITAAVVENDVSHERTGHGGELVNTASGLVAESDVDQPGRGDVLVVGDRTYAVQSWLARGEYWHLTLERVNPTERARSSLREQL